MKLDPKFEVKDNQLYTIAGEKVEFKFIDFVKKGIIICKRRLLEFALSVVKT